MYEATFRIAGDVAYRRATTGGDVSIELWCNDHCDLLHVEGDADGAIRREIEERAGVYETVDRGEETLIITDDCLKSGIENNVEADLAANDCLLLPPLRYEHGAKVVRVLALDPGDLTGFYQDVQESFDVDVRAKREVKSVAQDRPMLTVDSMLPELSERQREAVIAAQEAGYYAIPRETTTAELAETMDIDRRTYEEHLRRAENKLIGVLVDQLYA